MVKPEFFDDPDVADLSPMARLLFIGLWMQADRAGRLVDDARRLKARIFPYDTVDTEPLAVELASKDMIRRYSDGNGHAFIWIRNFERHQRPHPKEPASVLPPWSPDAVEKHGEPCKETAGRTLESNGVRDLRDLRKLENGAASAARFARFWDAYPNKKGKDDARRAWTKRHPSDALTDVIIAAVEEQKEWPGWRKDGGQFIPHPSTWLNRGQWEDEAPVDARAVARAEYDAWVCPHEPRCPHRVACAVVSARPKRTDP